MDSVEKDRHLLSGCISGNREAREAFVRRFSNLVYHYVQSTYIIKNIPYNRPDLEDLHHTVFVELFDRGCRKLKQYEGRNGCSPASWIRLVTVRIVLNHLRKKGHDAPAWGSNKNRQSIEDISEIMRGEGAGPLELLEEERRGRILQQGIQDLSPRDRLFIRLHFDQGLTLEQVASAMRISVGNAYTVKHRAINRLKANVAALGE